MCYAMKVVDNDDDLEVVNEGVTIQLPVIAQTTISTVVSVPDGGTVLMGGEIDGNYITPTVFDGVKPGDALAQDEIFGPVLSVITVRSTEEAIRVANDVAYGLTASIFTSNNRTALRCARELKAGTVTVNCYGEGDITTPFGGYKQSGFWSRDNGIHAHDQYTEIKTIWVDLSDPTGGDIA